MKPLKILIIVSLILALCYGPVQAKNKNQNDMNNVTDKLKQYGYNRDFLKKYINTVELKNDGAAIAVAPSWQGRVMTFNTPCI